MKILKCCQCLLDLLHTDVHFVMSLSRDKEAKMIVAFNSMSRYLDDLLNIDNTCLGDMINQIYPSELQLNKANSSDTEAVFRITFDFFRQFYFF